MCPFGNKECLCWSCEDSWLNCGESRCIQCIECDEHKKAVHDMYLCTWYKGIMPANCETCRYHLGGGDCRINLEAECGKGYFEAWEPKGKDHEGNQREDTEMMERGTILGRLDALRYILNLNGNKDYVEALDDAIALLNQKEGGNTMDMNTQRDEGTQKNEKRENARADMLEDIEAAIKGLKDVQQYGMFVQKEAECERKLSESIRLLRAVKEVLQG